MFFFFEGFDTTNTNLRQSYHMINDCISGFAFMFRSIDHTNKNLCFLHSRVIQKWFAEKFENICSLVSVLIYFLWSWLFGKRLTERWIEIFMNRKVLAIFYVWNFDLSLSRVFVDLFWSFHSVGSNATRKSLTLSKRDIICLFETHLKLFFPLLICCPRHMKDLGNETCVKSRQPAVRLAEKTWA